MAPELLYLSRADVEKVNLPMAEIIGAVEAVFREKGEGRVEMPAKIGIHPVSDDFLHAMPAYVASPRVAGIKWVGNFLKNSARALPTISGLVILNDPVTGLPMAVMDCTWITAKRTGAASAVAGKYLARADAEVLAIIGCGVQGRSHTEAMRVQFPGLRRVVAYDTTPASLSRYLHDVQAVHFDSQFTPEAIRAMDLLYTDDTAQMDYYRSMGYFQTTPKVQGDLGEVVAGKKPGRTGPVQRTMAMHLGLAIEDMVTAVRIYDRAVAQGIGTCLPL
jgi:ornithine cyclodeaminase/alanine dehydrogenase-like protein (mu-crystallin family)